MRPWASEPDRIVDLRTSSGVVRVHRLGSAHPDRKPIVLLPDRSSGVPAWEPNPEATATVFPDASHAVNGEHAAEVSRVVLAFVATHEDGSTRHRVG